MRFLAAGIVGIVGLRRAMVIHPAPESKLARPWRRCAMCILKSRVWRG
jgi:hypothetical protein